MYLFYEVMGVDQSLVHHIVFKAKDVYLTYIHNKTTNSVNKTVANVLTHTQDNYGQLMPHELLERE